MIGLRDPGGRWRTHFAHRLVARAFLGPCPDGMEVLHRDGDGSNARLSNLRYGTHADNGADMVRHGRTPRDRQGDTCDWGHRLEAPNLVESKLPARKCLACARSWYHVRNAGYQGVSHQAISDRHYRIIMGCATAEDMAEERTECARGHALTPCNLVPSKLPARCCLACSRALSAVRYAKSIGATLDAQTVADAKYVKIMGWA